MPQSVKYNGQPYADEQGIATKDMYCSHAIPITVHVEHGLKADTENNKRLKKQWAFLQTEFHAYRNVRGDDNCLYRALAYQMFHYPELIARMHAFVDNEYTQPSKYCRAIAKLDGTIISPKESFTFLQSFLQSPTPFPDKDTQYNIDGALIDMIRQSLKLRTDGAKANPEDAMNVVTSVVDAEQLVQDGVQGTEAEIALFADAWGVGVSNVAMLGGDKPTVRRIQPDKKIQLYVRFKTGHYSVLVPRAAAVASQSASECIAFLRQVADLLRGNSEISQSVRRSPGFKELQALVQKKMNE